MLCDARSKKTIFVSPASVTKQKKIYFYWRVSEENFLGDTTINESQEFFESELKGKIVASFFSRDANHFYLADNRGDIEVWDLRDLESIPSSIAIQIQNKQKKITSLNTIYGDTSLLVSIFSYIKGE